MDGKSHVFRIICSQDITEITGRHNDINLRALCNLTLLQQGCIGIDIVADLRNQTADIDGVCGRELESLFIKLLCQLTIRENLLHSGLCIVKIAVNTNHQSVFPLLGYHLLLLNRADTVLGIEYDDSGAFYISKPGQSCFTGITRGSCQNNNLILDGILTGCGNHKVRQDGKCHILECNGSTVEQLQIISSLRLYQRCNHFCIKLGIVRSIDAVFQFLLSKIGKEQLHHFICHLLIIHLRKFFQTLIHFRYLFRDKKSPVFG